MHPIIAYLLLALLIIAGAVIAWRIETPASRHRRAVRERAARAAAARKDV